MLLSKYRLHKPAIIFGIFAVTLGILLLGTPQKTSALSGADWQAGRIIDDAIFTDTSMSVDQIQAFLNQQVPNCDTWGTQPASEFGRGDLTHAQYATQVKGWPGPPYVCLKNYHEVAKNSPGAGIPANSYTNGGNPPAGSVSAAQMIYNAAKQYNVSAKVLMVKIQTESAGPLTQDNWPLPTQYTYAMGAHCPDSGPGGAAQCDANYAGFSIQISEAAALLRYYLDNMQQPWWPYKKPFATNSVMWNVAPRGCGAQDVYISTKATAALYTYTPYQPNASALSKVSNTSSGGLGDNCSAYGNRNFWWWFNHWYGNTFAFIYKGADYSAVFDANYYLNDNADLKAAFGDSQLSAFDHFIKYGMNEGRQGSADFNVSTYRNRYADLRWAYGKDLASYYWHYVVEGKKTGRSASGSATLQPVTAYRGVDYSSVYDYSSYLANNSDMSAAYGNDDTGALLHFINYGMSEGRIASPNFSVTSYKNRYFDLRRNFGSNLKLYYMHYLNYGKVEGRAATGDYYGGTSILNGVDYSSVYDFNTYVTVNSDMKNSFGTDDIKALQHFVDYGMSEGRIASAQYNVNIYKQNYADLRQAFGNNLRLYYQHYIKYGKAEGRIAS